MKTLKRHILLFLAFISLFATAQEPVLSMKPTSFKATTLYSQVPNTAAGDFVVTRAATAKRITKDGVEETIAANVPSVSYCAGTDIPVLNLMPDETITLSDLVAEGFIGASEGVIDKVVDGATVMN